MSILPCFCRGQTGFQWTLDSWNVCLVPDFEYNSEVYRHSNLGQSGRILESIIEWVSYRATYLCCERVRHHVFDSCNNFDIFCCISSRTYCKIYSMKFRNFSLPGFSVGPKFSLSFIELNGATLKWHISCEKSLTFLYHPLELLEGHKHPVQPELGYLVCGSQFYAEHVGDWLT